MSSSSSSAASSYSDDFAASMSAPSHKQAFEHAMYPPGDIAAIAAANGGTGPIRRHRSMTPSVMRNAEPIRSRPTTAGSDFASVGSRSPGSGPNNRGYHPYASYGSASQSRASSTHSSPAVGPVPLNGDGLRRSDSRSSSFGGVPEQMKGFVDMNLDSSSQPPQMFRTESPRTFTESPAHFGTDLPAQYNSGGTSEAFGQPTSAPVPFVMGGNQPPAHQSQFGGFYHPQQHVTL